MSEFTPIEIVPLAPEIVFEEFKKKHKGFLNFLRYPRDIAAKTLLESHNITEYLSLSLNTLYYAHQRLNYGLKTAKELNRLTFVEEPTPETPTKVIKSEQIFPITGTKSSGICKWCTGKGIITCTTCNGTGNIGGKACFVCDGRGDKKCSSCDGVGNVYSFEAEGFHWEPETLTRDYTPIEDMNFNKYIEKISPEGVLLLKDVENMPDSSFPSKEVKEACFSGLKLLKRRAETRIGEQIGKIDRWTLEKIELQENEGVYTPIIEINCKYEDKEFKVYAMGSNKKYKILEKDVPKNYLPLIAILGSIAAVITILLVLLLLP